ncbi:MAG TPA: Type 1 glutamine amidotransferase-like domain-containing protein [Thermoanaerobaculia bacterium]|jgi:cyanophycinase-like exopeptidase
MPLAVPLETPLQTLVLIGGGEFSFGETREIDALLLARMPPDRRTVAFLPTASGSAEYATHFGAYLRALDASVEVINVPIYRGRDNRRQKSLDAIRSAGLVYLGGGLPHQLLSTIRESPAEEALRAAAAGGAVIAAIGASASSFGAFARDPRNNAPLPGFGWLKRTAVETGFTAGNDTALRRMMSLPEIDLGIGLPSQTALVIGADGSAEVAGAGNVAAFRRP